MFITLFCTQVQANELTRYFKNLNTLEANFNQTVFAGNNAPQQDSKGLIIVKSPNQFYLEYTKPFKLLYVADGKKLWSYDEDLEQVVVKEQGNLLVNTPAMLLGNPKDLTKSYKVEKMGEEEGWIWFQLTPIKQNTNFESVSLAFIDNMLKAMEMRDNFGQTTRLEFTKVRKNPKLKKNQFNYTPPEGVDVIGQ